MIRNLRLSLVTETYFPQVNGFSRSLERLDDGLQTSQPIAQAAPELSNKHPP